MADQSKISKFFKRVKELPPIEPDEKGDECVHSQFYKDCLQKQHECQDERCINAKNEINQKREVIRGKLRQAEEAIKLCSMVLLEKDEEIENLRKQLESIGTNGNFGSLPDISSKPITKPQSTTTEEEPLSFIGSANYFTTEELSFLRSVGATGSDDSTFVASSVKFLYKQNLSVLKKKSVTGRSTKPGGAKQPITPKKYNVLLDIFTERINLITEDVIERKSRIKCMNKLIKDAIHNINKTTQANEIEKNACKQLEFNK